MAQSKRIFILAAGIALAATGCMKATPVEAPPAAITEADASVIAENTQATWVSGDVGKIMSLYKPGAILFDPGVAEPSDDRATQTKWNENWVAMKPSNFRVPNRRVTVLDADTFIVSGTGTADTDAKDAPNPISFRFSDVFERQADGKWLIVHEHISTPPKGT